MVLNGNKEIVKGNRRNGWMYIYDPRVSALSRRNVQSVVLHSF